MPGYAHRCVGLDNVSGALMATRNAAQSWSPAHRLSLLQTTVLKMTICAGKGGAKRCRSKASSPGQLDRFRLPDMRGRVKRRWSNCWGEISASPRCLPITTAWQAAGALTTLKDNGIVVPQHLSLIGFDDIPISRYTDPQLTTVRYPVMSMAKLATELALLGAAGKLDREATHCFMPTLVRRHSVAQRQTVGRSR
ncbi:substrate-binding domain-containing protein [Klebsiella pneumoniae subsp. pneumoniae]|nr:substrate-binding domain-containing protein [Klebsiella pneumoniae subsp. pneumoniae]